MKYIFFPNKPEDLTEKVQIYRKKGVQGPY